MKKLEEESSKIPKEKKSLEEQSFDAMLKLSNRYADLKKENAALKETLNMIKTEIQKNQKVFGSIGQSIVDSIEKGFD